MSSRSVSPDYSPDRSNEAGLPSKLRSRESLSSPTAHVAKSKLREYGSASAPSSPRKRVSASPLSPTLAPKITTPYPSSRPNKKTFSAAASSTSPNSSRSFSPPSPALSHAPSQASFLGKRSEDGTIKRSYWKTALFGAAIATGILFVAIHFIPSFNLANHLFFALSTPLTSPANSAVTAAAMGVLIALAATLALYAYDNRGKTNVDLSKAVFDDPNLKKTKLQIKDGPDSAITKHLRQTVFTESASKDHSSDEDNAVSDFTRTNKELNAVADEVLDRLQTDQTFCVVGPRHKTVMVVGAFLRKHGKLSPQPLIESLKPYGPLTHNQEQVLENFCKPVENDDLDLPLLGGQ